MVNKFSNKYNSDLLILLSNFLGEIQNTNVFANIFFRKYIFMRKEATQK